MGSSEDPSLVNNVDELARLGILRVKARNMHGAKLLNISTFLAHLRVINIKLVKVKIKVKIKVNVNVKVK